MSNREPTKAELAGVYILSEASTTATLRVWDVRVPRGRLLLRSDGTFDANQIPAVLGLSKQSTGELASYTGSWSVVAEPDAWTIHFVTHYDRWAGRREMSDTRMFLNGQSGARRLRLRLTADESLVFEQRR
jgi:hypothetical protein